MADTAQEIAAGVREQLERDGVDLSEHPSLAWRYVRQQLRRHGELALAGQAPVIEDEAAVLAETMASLTGLGPLQPYLDDPSVEELWINAPDRIFIARDGVTERVPLVLDETRVRELIERMLHASGRRVDRSSPFVDASLSDGSRLHNMYRKPRLGKPLSECRSQTLCSDHSMTKGQMLTAEAPKPNPGWYPNPDDASQKRWWDGEKWGVVAPAQSYQSPANAVAVISFVVGSIALVMSVAMGPSANTQALAIILGLVAVATGIVGYRRKTRLAFSVLGVVFAVMAVVNAFTGYLSMLFTR